MTDICPYLFGALYLIMMFEWLPLQHGTFVELKQIRNNYNPDSKKSLTLKTEHRKYGTCNNVYLF